LFINRCIIGGVKFVVELVFNTDLSSFFVIVLSENSIFIEDDGVIEVCTAVAFIETVSNDSNEINSFIIICL
jgi:hypothetical protein